MDRRRACTTLGAIAISGALPVPARAARNARIAWVSMDKRDRRSAPLAAFRSGVSERGWVEGRNLTIDTWWAEGSRERLVGLIPAIVASKPDVVVMPNGPAVRPLVDAGLQVPLVFILSGDPVAAKYVQSLGRPGFNRTGITLFSVELVPKRLELIRDLLPRTRRVALVGWPPHPGEDQELRAAQSAAARLDLEARYWGVNVVTELDTAFAGIAQWRPDAVLAFAGTITSAYGERFAAFSRQQRIPTVSAWASFVESGNLMSYGPVFRECYLRLALLTDRILNGASAADIPMERPTVFELVVNRSTAASLGIVVAEPVLSRVTWWV